MSKYFCPSCKNLTYSLHYIFEKQSVKPKGLTQYCKICDDYFHVRGSILKRLEVNR